MDQPPLRTSQKLRAARARGRPQGLSAMLLAFSVLFVLAYVFIIRQPPTPPAPTLGAVQGAYTWQSTTGGTVAPSGSGSFAAVAGGDARGTLRAVSGGATPLVSTYDAASRTERTNGGGETRSTVGAWQPAWRLATRSPLDYQGLAAVVRAAAEDGDTAVGLKPLEQDGRKVWRAAMTLGGVAVELVVDQASGLVTWYSDGVSTFTADVAWDATANSIDASGPAPEASASPGAASPSPDRASMSPGSTVQPAVSTTDRTYSYAPSLDAAGRAAGFDPVASDLAPDGFAQRAVATAPAGDAPASWRPSADGAAGAGAGGARQVVQLYLRGLTWFEVRQVHLAPMGGAGALASAVQTAKATGLSFKQTPLQYGVFAGRTASTWYEASGPTLLVGDGRRAVYVTGALTRQELLSLAEGFKPLGAGATASPAPAATSPSGSPAP